MENWINKIFKLLGEIKESLRVNHWIKMIREAKRKVNKFTNNKNQNQDDENTHEDE